jgi:hypothetical protein
MQQTASRSGESDMTASDAESWAKLRLVEGESSADKWELVSSLGHTTMTVGSNSDCTWVVRGEGVRPIHFSLHWDGATLRVADVYSAGDVRVDGSTLSSQWRPLLGKVRIDFGKAAMVVESSAVAQPSSAEHPLEQPIELGKPLETAKRGSGSPAKHRGSGKETLIGVAPQSLVGLQAAMQDYRDGERAASERPGSERPGSERPGSERPGSAAARAASDRSMKATLVGGIGIQPTPLPHHPSSSAPPGAQGTARQGVKPNATLMGFANIDMLRGVGTQPSVGSPGSLGDVDQRTTQGFPAHGKPSSSAPPPSSAPAGRRMTQKGMVSQPPGVIQDAVAQSPVRAVSERPGSERAPQRSDPPQRIGSAWQEKADAASRTLRGVQQHDEEAEAEPARQPRAPRTGAPSQWDQGQGGERLSDIPTQMRDPTTFESRRPSRGFPWRYVGVLVLTGVAYFAWLYLLDHM